MGAVMTLLWESWRRGPRHIGARGRMRNTFARIGIRQGPALARRRGAGMHPPAGSKGRGAAKRCWRRAAGGVLARRGEIGSSGVARRAAPTQTGREEDEFQVVGDI